MTKSKMMKKAHKLAKTMEGNYSVRLSIALKMVWADYKEMLSRIKTIEIPSWLANDKRISSGICKGNNIVNAFEVKRETEKALLISDYLMGDIWLPKSQINILA